MYKIYDPNTRKWLSKDGDWTSEHKDAREFQEWIVADSVRIVYQRALGYRWPKAIYVTGHPHPDLG